MKKEKGFNIDTTKGQYMMLYNIIAEYNPKDADPNFDMQTLIIYLMQFVRQRRLIYNANYQIINGRASTLN